MTLTKPGFESPYPAAISQVGEYRWDLLCDMVFWTRDGQRIDIPQMRTDFGSIPSSLWGLVKPYGIHTASFILHDHLWLMALMGHMSYRRADELFLEALLSQRVRVLDAYILWAAVRWAALLTRRGGHIGFWRDLPTLLPLTLLVTPIALVAGVANTVGSAAIRLLGLPLEVARRLGRDRRWGA